MSEDPLQESGTDTGVTLRCPFCLTLNQIDLSRAQDRPACGSCEKPMLLDRPVKVMEEDFDRTVLGAGTPVLVDFYADWCGPCKMVAPMVDEIASAMSGRLLVVKIDTDRAPGIAGRFAIRGIPTVMLFDGGEEVARSVGFNPAEIKALVERVA